LRIARPRAASETIKKELRAGEVPSVVSDDDNAAQAPATQVTRHVWPREDFTTDLVNMVRAKPDIGKSAAIVITVDEGGECYDSRLRATRIFSAAARGLCRSSCRPYTKKGVVGHTYFDHAPVLNSTERNWGSACFQVATPTESGRRRGGNCPQQQRLFVQVFRTDISADRGAAERAAIFESRGRPPRVKNLPVTSLRRMSVA
jgi:hypothetical protein